jgi:hypothetical protein
VAWGRTVLLGACPALLLPWSAWFRPLPGPSSHVSHVSGSVPSPSIGPASVPVRRGLGVSLIAVIILFLATGHDPVAPYHTPSQASTAIPVSHSVNVAASVTVPGAITVVPTATVATHPPVAGSGSGSESHTDLHPVTSLTRVHAHIDPQVPSESDWITWIQRGQVWSAAQGSPTSTFHPSSWMGCLLVLLAIALEHYRQSYTKRYYKEFVVHSACSLEYVISTPQS